MIRISPRRLALTALTTIVLGTGFAATAQAYPVTWGGHPYAYGYNGWGLLNIFNPVTSRCYIDRREFVDRHNRIYFRDVRVCG